MRFLGGMLLPVVLAGAGLAHAGQAADPGKGTAAVPVIRISIDRVQVDAVVTDETGRLVADLGPEDFTILQGGLPQRVVNVAYVDASHGAAGASPEHRRAPRITVIIFDDLGISLFSAAEAKSALQQFAREPFEPGDQVGLVRTSQDEPDYKFFESSEELLAASSKLRGNLSSMSGQDEASSDIPAMVRAAFDRRVHAIVGTIDGLRGLPGRKAVVLVSEGFPVSRGGFYRTGLRTIYDSLFYDESLYAEAYLQTLSLITEVANRSSVVVYGIDPRGVVGGLPPGQDSLQDLADRTGGLTVMNRNNLLGGLRRIVADQAGYYLLGFEPPPSTFERRSGRPPFHSVKVKVNRPGLKVRSRSGFYGITDEDVTRLAPKAATAH
jgi:VWFA-related protein